MSYDNKAYWQSLHRDLPGTLRSVGWPGLSENFNKLKYQSEADTILATLEQVVANFANNKQTQLSVLEIGVGIGYWTLLLSKFFADKGVRVDLSCLDISPDALSVVKSKLPHVRTIQADLKQIEITSFSATFDIVHAFAVLHHLRSLQDIMHGMQFAANSVKSGGYLLIYDPILISQYSPYNAVNWPTYTGNGMPYRISQVDDILYRQGFVREIFMPGISFMLNAPIEAPNAFAFKTMSLVWQVLCKFLYTNDERAKQAGTMLLAIDRFLKHKAYSFSSSVVAYRKLSV